ncbi:MAG TPA: AIR synthase-related protein [Oculatellaceae cyanobacterium]
MIKTVTSSNRIDSTQTSYKTYCVAVVAKAAYSRMALYWLELPVDGQMHLNQISAALTDVLCDPLQEELWISSPDERTIWAHKWRDEGFRYWAEKQFAPGVTDNLAHTVAEALSLLDFPANFKVASGTGYLFKSSEHENKEAVSEFGRYKFYHPIVEKWCVHDLESCHSNEFLTFPEVALPEAPPVTTISLELTDQALLALSRDRLLALTLEEMHAVRDYFRNSDVQAERSRLGLDKDPTDVELEVIAQTWSEHCKHKIFNATIDYNDGMGAEQQIKSLYKTFIQAPTKELSKTRKDLLSVFKDNSGVVKWNENSAVCFKVETHNSPSALEPYGGALTGILGVNRDILGTGLGAKPIFNTDVFCFAYPSGALPDRPKLLPAGTILSGVRKGVEDGGNKSGIPTVNGGIFFDPAYRAKPLVFCGTGGILPLSVHGKIAYDKHTETGDIIVMAGGRVGKDGVHGATFSSESLHEGSPVSAVQIGDPFTQKRLLDFVIEARDSNLITGITDNGAGGLSSSIGEMAQITNGATLVLDDVPTKYPGLADWEIVVSESQERMTLSTRDIDAVSQLAAKHNVEVTAVGNFESHGYFKIVRNKKVVCLLGLEFLHDGCPNLHLQATWSGPAKVSGVCGEQPKELSALLLKLLAHPNISSREEVIRQYDHEVQAASVIKPLMGEFQNAPCDAAVLIPIYGDKKGLVVSNGLAPRLSRFDTYLMACCAVDEAVRNAVCVGADPKSLSLLDNFCWPDPVASARNTDGAHKLAQLVRSCMGLKDAVMAFEAPLISGKDSMKNDFDDGVIRLSIPPTLLISAIGTVADVETCVSMEFKQAGDLIYLIKAGSVGFAGSHYEELVDIASDLVPSVDLQKAAALYGALHKAIVAGIVQSAHDVSDGGLAVAIAESLIASQLGADIDSVALVNSHQNAYVDEKRAETLKNRLDLLLFGEGPANIVVSVKAASRSAWESAMPSDSFTLLGTVTKEPVFKVGTASDLVLKVDVESLAKAWQTSLPFA